jgi:hypothetical protein
MDNAGWRMMSSWVDRSIKLACGGAATTEPATLPAENGDMIASLQGCAETRVNSAWMDQVKVLESQF